jgi:hypothetical protein
MKTLFISFAFCLLPLASGLAQTSAQLAADLQTTDAAHWPAIQALLIAQRDELTAAHLASLTTASADFKTKVATLTTERDAAKTELAELKQRIDTVLQTQLTEEMKTGDGPRAQLLRALIEQAGKSDAELKLEAAKAAEAAAIKARQEAEAALDK